MKRDVLLVILLLVLVASGLFGMIYVVNKVFIDCVNSIPTVETVDQGVFNG